MNTLPRYETYRMDDRYSRAEIQLLLQKSAASKSSLSATNGDPRDNPGEIKIDAKLIESEHISTSRFRHIPPGHFRQIQFR